MCYYSADDIHEALQHHGVKGQKWGVRRYQDNEGHHTPLGRKRDRLYTTIRRRTKRAGATMNDVNDIVNSLSENDKKNLDALDRYLSFEEGQFVVKRFLLRDGNKPVAFMDLIDRGRNDEGKQNLSVAIAVRKGQQGKHYGYEVASQGTRWIDKHMDTLGNVEWGAFRDNEASRKLAEKVGFQFDESKSTDSYVVYRR